MALVNLFIAFFIIVALSVSWLVLNLVFGGVKTSAPTVTTVPKPVAVAREETTEETTEETRVTGSGKKRATCRDHVVAAAKAVTKEKGANEFAAKEIVEYLIKKGTDYSTSTIRGSINSDLERVARGRYRLARG